MTLTREYECQFRDSSIYPSRGKSVEKVEEVVAMKLTETNPLGTGETRNIPYTVYAM